MAKPTKDDKRNQQLFKDTQVNKLVGLLNELDKNANQVVIRGLNGEITEAKRQQLLIEIRKQVGDIDPQVREYLKTAIPKSYVDGLNSANALNAKAKAGLSKETPLFKWTDNNADVQTDWEKIRSMSSGSAGTVGEGRYFALDPQSSSDFGTELQSFALPKTEKLLDITKNLAHGEASGMDMHPMEKEALKRGISVLELATEKGYSGVIFKSDDGLHKWVALTPKVAQNLKQIPLPTQPNVQITTEMLATDPDLEPHLKVVNNLLTSAYADFGNTMTGFVKGADKILSEAVKQQLRATIAVGRLVGDSIPEVKRDIKRTLSTEGFTVLLDKGGRQWSLGRYGEMLARTHILDANNEATVNRAKEIGSDIVEISNHNTPTPLCQEFEGKIFSLSGESKKYPQLRQEPPFHPNCKHFILLRPDLE